MNILISTWNTLHNLILVFRNEIGFLQKKKLFFTYSRLKLKKSLAKIFKLNKCETIFGFKINFFDYPTLIYLFEEIFIKKGYSFKSNKKNPFIIDCGSNIGISILFFKYLYPDSRIIGFEPDKDTFTVLKQNIEFNKLKNVTLINAAVYDSSGQINYYYDKNQNGSLLMSIKKERLPKDFKSVRSVLLSEHINDKVDFLKMDIEGAENLVFKELVDKKKLDKISEMAVEFHHHIDLIDDNLSSILIILEDNNFGYQISAPLRPPFNRHKFQDIMIYAYQKH